MDLTLISFFKKILKKYNFFENFHCIINYKHLYKKYFREGYFMKNKIAVLIVLIFTFLSGKVFAGKEGVIVKEQNGKQFLYDEKGNLKKGRVRSYLPEKMYRDENGRPFLIISFDVKKGLPSGDFEAYNYIISENKTYLALKADGKLKEDIFDGKLKEYYENGSLSKEVKGEIGINSDDIVSYNGQIELLEYKVIDGTTIVFYETGKKKAEGEYKNGKLHGKFKTWYPDGSKEEITKMVKGREHGKSTAYYENGELRYERRYYHGTLVYAEEYYINGDLKEKYDMGFFKQLFLMIIHLFEIIF